jgi:hypothetical protein
VNARVEDLGARVIRTLPSGLANLLRRGGAALLTPFLFSLRTGHLRSAFLGRPVDRHGNPMPWYTYPAVEFLSGQTLAGRRVLEFGAGYSTLWWAARAAQVVAFEDNEEWFRRLLTRLPANVQLHLIPPYLAGVEPLLSAEPFHIIVIDGLDRQLCARLAPRLLAPGGAVLLDDSHGYWGSTDGEYVILDLFRDQGFRRIDFCGFAPGVVRPRCTSLFFRDDCFLLSGEHPPAVSGPP